MKSVAFYPFNMAAGGTFPIMAEGDYFRVQSALGSVSVTIEGSGTLPDLQSGQGIKDTPFKRLILRNTSGAANSGVILVASEEFVDNRTYGVNDLSAGSLQTIRQPLAQTGFYSSQSVLGANTAETVFSAASNLNGAVVLSLYGTNFPLNGAQEAFISHTSAPANLATGSIVALSKALWPNAAATNIGSVIDNQQQIFLPAGQGLYFISSALMVGSIGLLRSARFRLL